MTALAIVTEKLSQADDSASVRQAKHWLEDENLHSPSDQAASATARQALHLWRTRLETARAKHSGMVELIEQLEKLPGQSKVEQYSFQGGTSTALFFFAKQRGTFLGVVRVEGKSQAERLAA